MSDNQNSFATIMPDNDSTPDMSDNGSMRSWAELPPLPLSLVFSYLGLAERAGMARVSSSWAKATAAATTTIELANCSNTRQPAAVAAQQHGGLAGGDNQDVSGVISSLPWPGLPRLQNVTVAHSSVDLRPGSQLLQDLSAATTLTRLELQVVTFQGEPDLAALLLALPNLLHLSFVYLNKVQASSQPLASPAQRSHAGLTSLWSGSSGQGDSCECFSDEGMQLLCSLTQLKALCLHSMRDVTAAGLVGLQSLQGLEVLVLGDLTCEISLSTVPAFSQLSALTHLNLKWVEDTAQGEFDPSVLAYMTQFKDLNLWDWTPSNGAAGAAELLSWLALMPLERLILAGVDSLEQCPPELISNLSASSVLRTLGCWGLGYQPGLWQHVLPDSRQLLQLTALSTSIPCETSALDLLARSCSQLEELCLCCTAGMELTALLQLTALSSVWLEAPVDSCPVASLAQLSGLQGLERLAITACPQDPCSISDDIVGSLTALTALTLLALPGEDGVLSAAMQQQLQRCEQGPFTQGGVFMDMPWRDRPCCVFTSTTPAGAPPDVWSQLMSCCKECARAAQDDSQIPAGEPPQIPAGDPPQFPAGAPLGVWVRGMLQQWDWGQMFTTALVVCGIAVDLWFFRTYGVSGLLPGPRH